MRVTGPGQSQRAGGEELQQAQHVVEPSHQLAGAVRGISNGDALAFAVEVVLIFIVGIMVSYITGIARSGIKKSTG